MQKEKRTAKLCPQQIDSETEIHRIVLKSIHMIFLSTKQFYPHH